jgi:hypothetical protein
MSEQTPKIENPESFSAEAFPYPKLIQTFNYFFPKEKGAPDIFTMENLKKFSRYAPYLTLGLLVIIFASFIRDMIVGEKIQSTRYGFYFFADGMVFIGVLLEYLYWLGASLFAKIVKRSPAIPLVMSFFNPLRAFGWLCIIHFFGFIIGGLISLGK